MLRGEQRPGEGMQMRIIEPSEASELASRDLPKHVAVIMDGNRRWGHSRRIAVEDCYAYSAGALISTLREARRLKIPYLSFFCLSSENLLRAPNEVAVLVRLSEWLWTPEVLAALVTTRARVALAGDTADRRLSQESLRAVEAASQQSFDITVTFAVNYGSRQELDRPVTTTTSGSARDRLYQPDHPDIDLVIRTSGEFRLSNFMLWQAAFAEFVFTDTLWPDFTGLHFASALSEYAARPRRHGR